jgi:hypothetical protein
MAGAYNAYYYTYTAWDVIRTKETPPGYTYVKNFYDFFNKTHYWLLKPSDALVSNGFCLADKGKEYVVYQDSAMPFTLDLTALSKSLKGQWYNPFSGKYISAGKFGKGKLSMVPPKEIGTGPVALIIK